MSVLIPTTFTAGNKQNNMVQTATVDDYGNDDSKEEVKAQFRNTVDISGAAEQLQKELANKVGSIFKKAKGSPCQD